MALLLETTIGDLVIDLDIDGSSALCKNVLKLAKARYYTGNLIYNVQPNRFCQLGDPCGDGSGGACIYGVLDSYEKHRKRKGEHDPDILTSQRRFLKSNMGRSLTEDECKQRGRVVATEMNGIADTIGSQLLITIDGGPYRALDTFRNNANGSINKKDGVKSLTDDGLTPQKFRSVGVVVEDDNDVLGKLNKIYCDSNGRPYADVRVIRALVIDDPFDDPEGMDQLLEDRGVTRICERKMTANDGDDPSDNNIPRYKVLESPTYEKPPEEKAETRISVDDIDEENTAGEDLKKMRLQAEESLKREDHSRAVVLEMLGDLPSANITAPENVLFICKLNPVTEDEDLELIFSRFDEKVSVDIVRDLKTGASLQYAFAEFTSKDQATDAYFKMNNALVDDRRIKVDFSQSVSKVWDRFNQRDRRRSALNYAMPRDPFKEQQQMPRRTHFRGEKESSNDVTRWNNAKGSNHSPYNHHYHDDTKGHHRDFAKGDRKLYIGSNSSNNSAGKHIEQAQSDSRCDDWHSQGSVGYHNHRDRYARDIHNHRTNNEKSFRNERDHNRSHIRSRNKGDDSETYSRSRDCPPHRIGKRQYESSKTRRSEKKQKQVHDGVIEDYSVSDKSEINRTERRKRKNDDRRRRNRSSSSESYVERRYRRRSDTKNVRKGDRRRDDNKRDHKRSRRDIKHRHNRKNCKETRCRGGHRDSSSSSR